MRKQPEISLFVCPLRTPANAGMLFRIAEGFRVTKLYFEKSPVLCQETVLKKKSRGAYYHVPHEIFPSLADPLLHFIRQPGHWLIGLENLPDAIPVKNWKPDSSFSPLHIGLLAGSENLGIPREYLSYCSRICCIPMYGKLTSHNVHVAVAMALYEITRDFMA